MFFESNVSAVSQLRPVVMYLLSYFPLPFYVLGLLRERCTHLCTCALPIIVCTYAPYFVFRELNCASPVVFPQLFSKSIVVSIGYFSSKVDPPAVLCGIFGWVPLVFGGL